MKVKNGLSGIVVPIGILPGNPADRCSLAGIVSKLANQTEQLQFVQVFVYNLAMVHYESQIDYLPDRTRNR